MLNRLYVKNYVLIDSLDVDFPEGLIIITGQTGAGKSILLGALSLVMGAKADADMISDGADNCVVEAEFALDPEDDSIRKELEENEVEWDGGHLVVRRVVNRSGRSRAFVNDSPVPVSVLQKISASLIDVHSQHNTRHLSDKGFQLSILDHYAGNGELRALMASLWRESLSLKSSLSDLDSRIERIERDRDYNQAQYDRLEAAALRPGEMDELSEEQKTLANAEEIRTCLGNVEQMFTAEASHGESMSLDSLLKEAVKQLAKAGKYVPAAADLSERVDACRHELDDVLSDVLSMNSSSDFSEQRLEQVEMRMSLVYGLMQKHGCRTEEELIELRDSLSAQLFDSEMLEQQRQELRKKLSECQGKLEDVAGRLHASRLEAICSFSDSITEIIREMELPYAVFEAVLSDSQLGATGCDAVTFRFSATGKGLSDVAVSASGGELSRIMLALKSMMARYANMPTMIFDEIDTGVSGSVADKMGSLICAMGDYMQVFAITHLPQVAAKGKAHYLVSKEINPQTGDAVSKIERLSDEQRVLELARMLSGSVLTEAAVANAKSLLG